MLNIIRISICIFLVMVFSNTTLAESHEIKCTLPASGQSANPESTPVFPLPAPESSRDICDGWPVNVQSPGAGFPYTPTLCDVDGDGAAEVFVTGGHTFGIQGDGEFLPGWPTIEHLYMGYGTNGQMPGPSVADMDQDGDFEILWSQRDWYAGSAHMWTFNGKNADGSNLAGFPQVAPDESSNALHSPFVMGDSNEDGFLEAWSAHTLGNTNEYDRISGFDHEGTLLFTRILERDETTLNLFFGDVDGDDQNEFFAVTLLDGSFMLRLFTADGQDQSGYPVILFTPGGGYLTPNPPLAADLDDDGDLEILVGYWGGSESTAIATNHDGIIVDGFPLTIATSSQLFSIGLGDITGDHKPELLACDNHLGGNYRVWAIDLATGTPVFGWPFNVASWPKGIPTVVDVDNDGKQDVCVATDAGEIYAISGMGNLLNGYPLSLSAPSISGVSAGDIDGDGLFELVASTWDGFVYAFNTQGEVLPGRADWPQRGVDAHNTGVYQSFSPTSAAPQLLPGLSLTTLTGSGLGEAHFRLVTPASMPAQVMVYNLRGHHVRDIFQGTLDAGSRVMTWNGRDSAGRNVSSGVYLIRAKVKSETLMTKVLLVR